MSLGSLRSCGPSSRFPVGPPIFCSTRQVCFRSLSSSSFTWSSTRLDRNTVTVMSGQTVDFFDTDFRELYAVSEHVDLYREFNITKPPEPAPEPAPAAAPIVKPVEPIRPLPVSTSRFQVSVNDSRQVDLKVPAHKYHNPKYSLVFGNSRGLTGSLQDLSTTKDSPVQNLHPSKDEDVSPESLGSPAEEEDEEEGKGGLKKNTSLRTKKLSSIKHFLKSRATNHIAETIEEGVATPQSPASPCKAPESNGVAAGELDDTFEPLEKLSPLKPRSKKPSKTIQRSLSLQTLNMAEQEGGCHQVPLPKERLFCFWFTCFCCPQVAKRSVKGNHVPSAPGSSEPSASKAHLVGSGSGA